ncbi:hypothetical protein PF005_g8127 [Phytophthora fragariae]|nr:hypothetical protein PF003_g7696 [Phytophthora fragariae]KAE8941754.1 hypothetical protein PF009_g8464 [Phytophthora fragariae]KAE9120403.1 hypothetical protein PF007_g8186 [Phytophthora fragariae]KAE9151224.1 hypothetical protein PF006_g4466 [Phytophthora fragariae]KAE9218778.1 hypothetical protein PF005_g8127 [Phytophthora fragariae]
MALPLTLIVLLRGYAVFGAQRSVRRYTPQNCNNTLDKIMQPCPIYGSNEWRTSIGSK